MISARTSGGIAKDRAGGDPTGWGAAQTRERAGLMTLLLLTMGIGPYVLYTLSALAPHITRDLALTRTQLGSLVTVAFGVAAVTAVAGGRLADRWGSRTLLYLLYLSAGAGLLGIGGAVSYATLVAATAVAGFAQSAANPVTNRLISLRVSAGRRGLAMGVKQSGVQLCQFLAGVSLPLLALAVGWRGAVWLSLALIPVGIVLTVRLVPRTEQSLAVPSVDARPAAVDRARTPTTLWLAVYAFLLGVAIQGTNVYMALYAFERFGFTSTLAGLTVSVVGAAGVAGRIGWAQAAERTRTAIGPLGFLAAFSVLGFVIILVAEFWGAAVLWVGLLVFALSTLPTSAVVMLALVRGVQTPRIGVASGQVTVGLFTGFMAGPMAFGAVVDTTGYYWAGWTVLAACCAVAAALCLRLLVIGRRIRPSLSTSHEA